MEEWDSQRIPQWKVPGEMPELLVFMKYKQNQQNAICGDVDQKKSEGHVDLLGPATREWVRKS
jgi:hypothetical protein